MNTKETTWCYKRDNKHPINKLERQFTSLLAIAFSIASYKPSVSWPQHCKVSNIWTQHDPCHKRNIIKMLLNNMRVLSSDKLQVAHICRFYKYLIKPMWQITGVCFSFAYSVLIKIPAWKRHTIQGLEVTIKSNTLIKHLQCKFHGQM